MRRYFEVLKLPSALLLVTSSLPARIAYGMLSLGIYFKIFHETKSISLAGLAVGLNALAGSLTAGIRSSVIDKLGLRIPLRFLVPAFATSIVFFNQLHNKIALAILAVCFGLFSPPINLSVRPIWKLIAPEEKVRTAFALDTAIMSFAAVIGPVIVTTLALSSHPSLALNVCAVLMLVGGISLALLPITSQWKPEEKIPNAIHILKMPAIRLLILEGIFIGIGNGVFEITVPAISTLKHVPHRAGWLFGAFATANIIGSLLAGLISKRVTPLKSFKTTYLFWVLIAAPLTFTNPNWSLFALGSALGIVVGAQMVFYWELVEIIRPQGSAASALGWLWTFEGTAAALGSALGGYICQTFSPRYGFAFFSICILIGFTIIKFGSARLQAADRLTSPLEDQEAISSSLDKRN